MKRITILIVATGIWPLCVQAQDMFPVRQMTFDPAPQGFPSWSPDGSLLIYQHTDMRDTSGKNGLWSISPGGAGTRQIFSGLAEHPKYSPDGRYIVYDADSGKSMKLIPAGGGSPVSFLPDTVKIFNGGMPCWSPDAGRIAFIEGERLSLCIYDLNKHSLVSIFNQEGMIPIPGCWYMDGKNILVALMDKKTRKSTMWKVSADGKEKKQITGHKEFFYRHLTLSPDGLLMVYAAMDGKYLGLYIMPAGGGESLPLTVTPQNHNEGPSWSPDGTKIAFSSTRSGNGDIWIMDVDIDEIRKKLGETRR